MTHEEIQDETAKLLGAVNARDWKRAFVETSCITGPFPWRITFGAFGRRPTMIQGLSIEDAFAKAWCWIGTGSVDAPAEEGAA